MLVLNLDLQRKRFIVFVFSYPFFGSKRTVFRRNCPTLTVDRFLYAYDPLFVQLFNLNYGCRKPTANVKTSRTSKTSIGIQTLAFLIQIFSRQFFRNNVDYTKKSRLFLKFCKKLDVEKSLLPFSAL